MCCPDGNTCYIVGGTDCIEGARDQRLFPIVQMDCGSMEISESEIKITHRENPVFTKLTPMFMAFGYGYR